MFWRMYLWLWTRAISSYRQVPAVQEKHTALTSTIQEAHNGVKSWWIEDSPLEKSAKSRKVRAIWEWSSSNLIFPHENVYDNILGQNIIIKHL